MNNKNVILHICHDYGKMYKNLISSLCSFDHIVYKYNMKHNNNIGENDNDILIYNNSFKIPGPAYYLSKLKNATKWLEKNIDFNKVDIIHAHMLFSDGIIAMKLKEKYNIPYIIAVRNTDLYSKFYWRQTKIKKEGLKVLLNAEKIVFLSSVYKDSLLKKVHHKIRNDLLEKSLIIPNGVDNFWIKNQITEPRYFNFNEGFKVITVGRIENNKNQLIVKKALKKIRKMGFNVSYKIIGEIRDVKIVTKLKKENFISIIPYKDKTELIHLYKDSNIFIMPSKKETFGLTYCESLTQGLPVIYSKGQGFDKQFIDGYVGYPVRSSSVKDIVIAIFKIFLNYHSVSSNCLLGAGKFNLRDLSNIYENLYHDILNSPNGV